MPERLRVLGTLDTFLLWTNLGISLLVLVAASYFGLSLKQALLATLLGGLIGNAMLGLAGMIGADARVPTMVLQRAPLGQRGSYLATGLNVLQCMGWAIFELIIIATAAAALSDRVFDFRAEWMWKLVFGGSRHRSRAARADLVRPPLRPQGRHLGGGGLRPLPRRLDPRPRPTSAPLWDAGGQGGSFFGAMDLVIALCVSWIPLVADYTRFSTTRRAAFVGTGTRLPPADAVPVRLRCDPGALAPVDRRARRTS